MFGLMGEGLRMAMETEQRARTKADGPANYLRDWVYGGIDGAVTTFAVVAGVAGAALSTDVILILGFANLVADGFSMAAGNFSSSRTEAEQYERLFGQVERRLAADPERERAALRRFYEARGFADEALDHLVATIGANEEGWARTMMVEEFGLAPIRRSPWLAAGNTYAAFLACGLVPLLPYLVGLGFVASAVMTGMTFFAIGSLRSRWTDSPWWRSGLVTFGIGGIAAIIAYVIGYGLRLLVGDAAI
jgi:VIT1/CCC1 family predicted Fe2+/Mn2+ transporter